MYLSVGMHCLMKLVIQESAARICAICHSQRVFTGESFSTSTRWMQIKISSSVTLDLLWLGQAGACHLWKLCRCSRTALCWSSCLSAEWHVYCVHLYPMLFFYTGDFWIICLLSYLKHLMLNWKTFLKLSTFLRVNYWVSLVVLPLNSIYLQFPALERNWMLTKASNVSNSKLR